MADDYQESAPEAEGVKLGTDSDLWRRIDKRWRYVQEVDQDNRKAAEDDNAFVWVKGRQWPDRIRQQRDADGRPWLEINQLPQFIHQVVNDQRQNRPAIKVRPVSAGANEDAAEIREGLVRHIEYDSQAPAIYDTGFEQAVTTGRGYWRICTEYESESSFNQKITLRQIPNFLSVAMDPDYQRPDGSDAEWCFVAETLTRDEFKERYPKADPLDFEAMDTETLIAKWIEGNDKLVVADYFEREYTSTTLCLLSDGSTVAKDDLPEPDAPIEGAPPPGEDDEPTYVGRRIVQERETRECRVCWYKCYGGGVLEAYDWAGKYIPIVCCFGDVTIVDGKRVYQGLVRRARDVQTMFNFWQTKATEQLALAPAAQWLMPDDSIEGYETIWDNANIRNFPRLPYHHDPTRPPPQRLDPVAPQVGVLQQATECRQDFYTTIGIYPPSLGKESNEVSGIAINYRQQQGDRATFHFVDNLSRAIEHTGRIVLDLIPRIYDTPRQLAILAEDGEQRAVQVNQQDPLTGQIVNDLRNGEYGVVVDVGPSYATRRMEAAQSMLEFMQAYPPAAQLLGDMLARNQDWADADKIAARLQAMLPPQIQMMEAQDGGDPKVAAMATAMQQQQQQFQTAAQQMQQQMQALQAENAKLTTQAQQAKLSGLKTALTAVTAQHDAQMKVGAEQQRTGIEAYRADTDRLAAVYQFVGELLTLQQKQMQPVGPEAVQVSASVPAVRSHADLQ